MSLYTHIPNETVEIKDTLNIWLVKFAWSRIDYISLIFSQEGFVVVVLIENVNPAK